MLWSVQILLCSKEAIKKFESLPAELESIKAVLEMKNEEIKQLRKEKMEKYLEVCLHCRGLPRGVAMSQCRMFLRTDVA